MALSGFPLWVFGFLEMPRVSRSRSRSPVRDRDPGALQLERSLATTRPFNTGLLMRYRRDDLPAPPVVIDGVCFFMMAKPRPDLEGEVLGSDPRCASRDRSQRTTLYWCVPSVFQTFAAIAVKESSYRPLTDCGTSCKALGHERPSVQPWRSRETSWNKRIFRTRISQYQLR